MGNSETHNLGPVRNDERQGLDLSRHVTYKQYCRHVEGRIHESCLLDLPWSVQDSISLYERMTAAFNAITDLPKELPFRLPHLNYMDLSHNHLTSLPENFGLLFHLKTLLLSYNRLTSLPDSFASLIKLEKLDLSHNQLKSLPQDFTKMECLTRLNVSKNRLKVLPVSLGGVKSLKVLIACDNKLHDPPQSICDCGSDELIAYLRKSYNLSGSRSEVLPASSDNIFPRVRGNHLQSSVLNPHSAQVQYIQSQTHTTNTPSRVKTPLLPPPDASSLDADVLRDRIIGLIYGAAIGDAIGLATCCMQQDEINFHYRTDMITFSDVVADQLRVRWKPADWTSNFDTMVLVLDCIISWAGVVDELDFARRLHNWILKGFPELGDTEGIVLSETVKQVSEHREFLHHPHEASKQMIENYVIERIQNGFIPNDDDCSSVCSDQSSLSERSVTVMFPSSHPCIESHVFGTDNGAVVLVPVLGIPCFHLPEEVEANTVRICRTTHSDPRCVASCVLVTSVVSYMLQGKFDLDSYKTVDEMIHKAVTMATKYLCDKDHVNDFLTYCNMTDVKSLNAREPLNMSYTFKAMAAGLIGLRSQMSFKSFIMKLILEGGDSNSNGCVAGALLGCKVGYSHLPQDWVQGLRKKQTTMLNIKINHLLDMIGLP